MGQIPPNSQTLGSDHGGVSDNTKQSGEGPINSNQPIMVGRVFGQWRVVLTENEMPEHDHDLKTRSDLQAGGGSRAVDMPGSYSTQQTYKTGGDYSHNNAPQCVTVHYIIKI